MHKEDGFKDSTSGEASYINYRDASGALVVKHGYKGVDEWILILVVLFTWIPYKYLFSIYEKVDGVNVSLDNNDTFKIVSIDNVLSRCMMVLLGYYVMLGIFQSRIRTSYP